jgi:hypothetical protein
VVYDDHSLAECFNVGHVVACQQDRRAVAAVVFGDERADPPLHRDVKADGRFVEKQDLGLVKEGDGNLALHALAEGELADGLGEQWFQIQKFNEFVKRASVLWPWDAIDCAVQFKGVCRGNVPRQLIPLAHHEGDLTQKCTFAA